MKWLIRHLISEAGVDPKRIFFVSLDDYALAKISILTLVEEFRKLHGIRFEEKLYLFFDEVTYQKDFEIEIQELSYMTSSTESYFNKESSLPNFYIVAMWEAERLAIEGTTEKIRVFSKKVANKFEKYYTSMQK